MTTVVADAALWVESGLSLFIPPVEIEWAGRVLLDKGVSAESGAGAALVAGDAATPVEILHAARRGSPAAIEAGSTARRGNEASAELVGSAAGGSVVRDALPEIEQTTHVRAY